MIESRRTVLLVEGLMVLGGFIGSLYVMVTSEAQDLYVRGILQPNNAAIVSEGRKIYAMHCASCHGVDLQGQVTKDGAVLVPPHNEEGHTWQHPDQVLFEITKYGKSASLCQTGQGAKMPTFGESLSNHEVIAVLSFISAQWPENIQEMHDQINQLYFIGTENISNVE